MWAKDGFVWNLQRAINIKNLSLNPFKKKFGCKYMYIYNFNWFIFGFSEWKLSFLMGSNILKVSQGKLIQVLYLNIYLRCMWRSFHDEYYIQIYILYMCMYFYFTEVEAAYKSTIWLVFLIIKLTLWVLVQFKVLDNFLFYI